MTHHTILGKKMMLNNNSPRDFVTLNNSLAPHKSSFRINSSRNHSIVRLSSERVDKWIKIKRLIGRTIKDKSNRNSMANSRKILTK